MKIKINFNMNCEGNFYIEYNSFFDKKFNFYEDGIVFL